MPEDYARDQHASQAAMERLWSHAIGIANRALPLQGRDPRTGLPAREEEAPGTGVAGFWGTHHFILTARHVLESAQVGDVALFARPTPSLRHATEVTLQDGFAPVAINDSEATIHRCDWEDLALITIRPDSLSPHVEFADLAAAWIDPSEGESVSGLGYPVSHATIFNRQVGPVIQGAVLLSPIAFQSDVLPASTGRYFDNFVPESHYLFTFTPAAQGRHPRGISGAAMWAEALEPQIVWTAQFKFAGICTVCYQDGNIEQVIKASVVRQFLQETFGSPFVDPSHSLTC